MSSPPVVVFFFFFVLRNKIEKNNNILIRISCFRLGRDCSSPRSRGPGCLSFDQPGMQRTLRGTVPSGLLKLPWLYVGEHLCLEVFLDEVSTGATSKVVGGHEYQNDVHQRVPHRISRQ